MSANPYIMDYKDKEMLERLYLGEKLSTPQIADKYNVTAGAIYGFMKKFNIPYRSNGESQAISKANHCKLNKKAKEFLYGELLGDMHIGTKSGYSAYISYSSKYLSYLNWLLDQLSKMGIRASGSIFKQKVNGREYYHFNSKLYSELLELRQMFYPNGIKIIPEDLEFSPLVIRQWYIGDGCLHKPTNRNASNYIAIATYGFDPTYVSAAVGKLNSLGFKTVHGKDNTIRFSVYSTVDFLDYIGPCPIDCYSYKWATKNRIGQLAMPLKN